MAKKIKIKTHKALAKRLKVSSKGKIFHRKCGQSHFNIPESGKTTMAKRKKRELSKAHKKTIRKLLPYLCMFFLVCL